ncbi:unnamed protein product [Ambrosiozyma monospora]|uniref:Unnamed protein product n=1 Tax=Ambrosiozyma monospora TaxID=43982 RepID=A0A9W6YYT6_AMBMO|nr:unnamed protein product [Ambrosiozyma monospora]
MSETDSSIKFNNLLNNQSTEVSQRSEIERVLNVWVHGDDDESTTNLHQGSLNWRNNDTNDTNDNDNNDNNLTEIQYIREAHDLSNDDVLNSVVRMEDVESYEDMLDSLNEIEIQVPKNLQTSFTDSRTTLKIPASKYNLREKSKYRFVSVKDIKNRKISNYEKSPTFNQFLNGKIREKW